MSGARLEADLPAARWHRPLAATAIALTLGGLAYLAGLAWPSLFREPHFDAAAPAGCDLNLHPCRAVFDGDRLIRLSLQPRTPRVAQPLHLRIDTAGFAADTVEVEFSGVDMNMGRISIEIPRNGEGSFAGEAALPACVRQRMSWHALVTARGPEGVHRATFMFEVNRP